MKSTLEESSSVLQSEINILVVQSSEMKACNKELTNQIKIVTEKLNTFDKFSKEWQAVQDELVHVREEKSILQTTVENTMEERKGLAIKLKRAEDHVARFLA